MPSFLTRKYGGVPGWAIAGGAIVAGLLFFYFRRQSSSTSSTGSTTGMVNNPAASAPAYMAGSTTVPYVPSVTVTGLPVGATTPSALAPSPASQAGSFQVTYPAGTWIFAQPTTKSAVLSNVPQGTQLTMAGSIVQGENVDGVSGWAPVTYGGLTGYVSGARGSVSGGGGGDGLGGWGQSGSPNAVAMMGWTAGWQPVSLGPGNRATAGSGRGDAPGSGGGIGAGSPSRTRAVRPGRALLPLRRRSLSGR